MKKLPNIHPGKILAEEFLKGFNISAYQLAKETKMPSTRVSEIIKGRRRITADTALRLSKFFGTTAEFWLGLQLEYDLREERTSKLKEINSIRTIESIQSTYQ
jgi:antitoxin HigA-1